MQRQTVSEEQLEKKAGRRLSVGDTFETPTGTWKVVATVGHKLTVELL